MPSASKALEEGNRPRPSLPTFPLAHNPKSSASHGLRRRAVPVDLARAEDATFVEDNLNDLNLDITSRPPPYVSTEDLGTTTTPSHSKSDEAIMGDNFEYEDVDSANDDDEIGESPYPEVRAVVSETDDPTMPVNTVRMWFLGIMCSLLTSGFNQIFSLRYPGMWLYAVVTLLISLPMGKALARVLPAKRFKTFGYTWSLNPGPFNVKEHACVTLMSQISISGAYSNEITLVQRRFFDTTPPLIHQLLLAIGTEVLGFAAGGVLHYFLVLPPSMIWPSNLVYCALFNALHREDGTKDVDGQAFKQSKRSRASRERFFYAILVGSFVWYWVPGYLVTALSMFNWVCWIVPNHVIVNTLFGSFSGLGMSFLSFDWGMINFTFNPLITPWWAQLNTAMSFALLFWVLAPAIYFSNLLNTAHFPLVSPFPLDNTGARYNFSRLITDGQFDVAKYEAYSPLFLSVNLFIVYGCMFAFLPSLVVHTFLWYRKDVARTFRSSWNRTKAQERGDIHARLMARYPQVPWWWYGLLGVTCFALLVTTTVLQKAELPVWGVVFGVVLAFVLALPVGILYAIANHEIPIQVIPQLIAGYIFPGKLVANTLFKAIGANICMQGINFASNLKLGHYMKIPPRMTFAVQVVATIVAAIWAPTVQAWMIQAIPDLCAPRQAQGFICPGSTGFASSAVIWGGIGPARLFNFGKRYGSVLWFLVIGFIAPIPPYLLARRYPFSAWRYFSAPICFGVVILMGLASALNYTAPLLVGFVFERIIRRKYFKWWRKYNHTLSAALDAGTAISMLVIFFSLQVIRPGGISLVWKGNTIMYDTADAMGTPWKPIPESGVVGPSSWN